MGSRSMDAFDIQPCLGVFINSVPGMADNNPFNLDMVNLIKSKQLVIREFQRLTKKMHGLFIKDSFPNI